MKVNRGPWEGVGRGDQAGLDLAGPPAFADDEIAQHAPPGAPVVGGDRLQPGPIAHRVSSRVAKLGGQPAVLNVDDHIPAPASMEAERQLGAVGLAEGVLELVAVAPPLDRRLDLLQLEPVEAADPPQGVLDQPLLVGQLVLVGEALPGRSGAGLAAVGAAVGDAVGSRTEQLDRPRLGEAAL